MKNILSYQPGTQFTGKEILDFINHSTNKEVKRIRQHYSNVKEDALYRLCRFAMGPGADQCRIFTDSQELGFMRVDKNVR